MTDGAQITFAKASKFRIEIEEGETKQGVKRE
jgi:hypothetical protein